MNTATISEQARRYLDAVKQGLVGVLNDEDAEEVLLDLEAHLAEIDPTDMEDRLGTPAEFVAEFRSSAGLDEQDTQSPGRIARISANVTAMMRRNVERVSKIFEPFFAPLVDRRDEIVTAWIWSRGILAVLAFSWASSVDAYGVRSFLFPKEGNLVIQLGVVALATFASVSLGAAAGKWWKRVSLVASLGIGFFILVAITTNQYVSYPEEQAFYYYGDDAYAESVGGNGPGMLIGPDGPIQNVYAYDLEGNPVEVLLYDEQGNPLLTLPGYAYDQATNMPSYEPFIWEGFEIIFREDTYGRPIGNLFPLERYDWTQTGARSAPQPPPVVGIPDIPVPEDVADEIESAVTASTVVTTTSLPEQPPVEATEPPVETTEPPMTTTTQAE